MTAYLRHCESSGPVNAPVDAVFAFLDDQSNLSAHMNRRSGMMLGSTMDIHMEADHTGRVGSRFGFSGRLFGLPLAVEEIVTARDPPTSKRWETTSEPRLWVIGRYEMGFALTQVHGGANLWVDIRYDLPAKGLPRLLGWLLGDTYAGWCTRQMLSDAQRHFGRMAPTAAA